MKCPPITVSASTPADSCHQSPTSVSGLGEKEGFIKKHDVAYYVALRMPLVPPELS